MVQTPNFIFQKNIKWWEEREKNIGKLTNMEIFRLRLSNELYFLWQLREKNQGNWTKINYYSYYGW